MEEFGRRLRAARQRRGLTQLQVSEHLNIDRTTYCKYETGLVEPHLETLWRLSQLLEVSTDSLLSPD